MSEHANNRITRIFEEHRQANTKALMPFVVGGHPTPDSLPTVIKAMDDAGADIIEIGFPFSDPIADGPVIAAAMHEALQNQVTPGKILESISAVRPHIKAGLVAMLSVSITDRLGRASFLDRAVNAGLDGVILPDLDPEQAPDVANLCDQRGLSLGLLVGPATTGSRVARILDSCRGFVYLLARAGITGESKAAPEVEARVTELRKVTKLPIACGFGIGSPSQVEAVTKHADAAIVGSALVRRLQNTTDPASCASTFVQELRTGLAQPAR